MASTEQHTDGVDERARRAVWDQVRPNPHAANPIRQMLGLGKLPASRMAPAQPRLPDLPERLDLVPDAEWVGEPLPPRQVRQINLHTQEALTIAMVEMREWMLDELRVDERRTWLQLASAGSLLVAAAIVLLEGGAWTIPFALIAVAVAWAASERTYPTRRRRSSRRGDRTSQQTPSTPVGAVRFAEWSRQ